MEAAGRRHDTKKGPLPDPNSNRAEPADWRLVRRGGREQRSCLRLPLRRSPGSIHPRLPAEGSALARGRLQPVPARQAYREVSEK